MARRLLATLVGLCVAIAIIVANEYLDASLFPPPAGLDYKDKAAMSAFVASLPFDALAIVLLGWLLATFVGGWVALRLSADRTRPRPAMLVALALMVAAVTDMASFSHPLWFWVAAIFAIPSGAWLAIRACARAKRASGTSVHMTEV